MKVTLDLDMLLAEGRITRDEYFRLSALSMKSTGVLGINLLTGFGVAAVAASLLALVPEPITAVVLGLGLLVTGGVMRRVQVEHWDILAGICVLIGALLTGGGILVHTGGSLGSILAVTALFAVSSIVARSALMAALATLMLSSAIGAKTGYFHASYFVVIQEPVFTIALFTGLAIGLFLLSKRLPEAYARLAIVAARTSVFLVNIGFWIGSLWGEPLEAGGLTLGTDVFSVLWAVALLLAGGWAWWSNRRWLLNIAAVFAGIHFYTQWFEHLGATPGTVLVSGLLALGLAMGLRHLNERMRLSAYADQ